MKWHEIMNFDDLNEQEKEDFQKTASFFFSEIINILDTLPTDKDKIDWIKEMDELFKEPIK